MVIIQETKKQEIYTPLAQFGDRVIDLKTFFEGIKINFKRELTLSFNDSLKENIIVTAGLPDVKISNTDISIINRNIGMVTIIPFKTVDLSAINEVSNVSSIDYIFLLAKNRKMFYRIKVR